MTYLKVLAMLAYGVCCIALSVSHAEAGSYGAIPSKESGSYSMMEMAKRVAPEPVVPLTMDGVRYEAPFTGEAGILVAYDVASGDKLWTLPVYKIDFDKDMETDVQEIYITVIKPNAEKTGLIVTDEHGRAWAVDLKTQKVTLLTEDK